MKTLSKTILLCTALSVSALSSGQIFAEGVAMIGSDLIAYDGAEQTTVSGGQFAAVPVIGANLIAYHGAEQTTGASAEPTGSFCSTTSAKRANSNFNPGATGLLSAKSSC